MKLSHAFALSVLGLSLAGSAAALDDEFSVRDNCINKDLMNLGPTAYDVGVLITGNQPVTWTYDGNPGEVFQSFNAVPAGPNTFLHWRNINGVDAPILTGDIIHVGWCTKTHQNIVDMWWTDKQGGRVPGSVIHQTWAHSWSSTTHIGVRFDHAFAAEQAIVVSNVRAAVSDTPWRLEQLNRDNTVLADQLRDVPGGTAISLTPGSFVELPLDGAVAGQWVTVVYDVSAEGSASASTDFVQFRLP
jgi:hypothetical protein